MTTKNEGKEILVCIYDLPIYEIKYSLRKLEKKINNYVYKFPVYQELD